MSDFTEQEFNEAMARLMYPNAEIRIIENTGYIEILEFDENGVSGREFLPCCNDLNLLMPIAFKYVVIPKNSTAKLVLTYDEFIQAIRDRLWQIYKEQK